MNMKIDQRLISWPRYSKYEIITAPNGSRYIRPTEESHPVPFHYVKEKERMVIDAVNVGMLVLGQKSEAVIEKAVLEFVTKHGLLGLMTALPNSPDFMEYEVTFLPKNRFIRELSMKTDAYQKLFFPFHDLQNMQAKIEQEPNWKDPDSCLEWQMMMSLSDQPEGVMMTALKEYAEPYDWVVDQLKDWAYMVSTAYVFYNDGFIQDLQLRISMQEGMEAYGGIAPSYIILLREKPTLRWHFHSLHQCIHLTLLSCWQMKTIPCVCASTVRRFISQTLRKMSGSAARNVKTHTRKMEINKRKQDALLRQQGASRMRKCP